MQLLARSVPGTAAAGMTVIAMVATIAISTPCPGAATRSTITQEYHLKAAFLFNFARFVEWPADAWARNESPRIR